MVPYLGMNDPPLRIQGKAEQEATKLARPSVSLCDAAAVSSVTGPGTRTPVLTTWLLEGRRVSDAPESS
jgi:hypothetical protein